MLSALWTVEVYDENQCHNLNVTFKCFSGVCHYYMDYKTPFQTFIKLVVCVYRRAFCLISILTLLLPVICGLKIFHLE